MRTIPSVLLSWQNPMGLDAPSDFYIRVRHKPSRLCLGVAKLILLVELCKSLSYFLLYGYFCLEGRSEFTHFAHCDFRIFRKGTNFCRIGLSGCLKMGGGGDYRYPMCKRSGTERGELPSSTNLIASNFSSNVLLRI